MDEGTEYCFLDNAIPKSDIRNGVPWEVRKRKMKNLEYYKVKDEFGNVRRWNEKR